MFTDKVNGLKVMAKADIGYLVKELEPDGQFIIKSADFFKGVEKDHITQYCVENGLYCLPTLELLDFLREVIKNDFTIEIGAGRGILSKGLNIVGTDSFMQEREDVKEYYNAIRTPTVRYGEHVHRIDAERAVSLYKPRTVIAAWVTHKFNPMMAGLEGNEFGVDEGKLIKNVKQYIFIGNTYTHASKPILKLPHQTVKPPWLISRAIKDFEGEDVIWVWEKREMLG